MTTVRNLLLCVTLTVMVPTPSAIRCVVFDLGGVLVRICRSWDEACRRAGIPCCTPALDLREQYETGHIGCDEFFQRAASGTGGLLTSEAVRSAHKAYIIEEYPGVTALIDALHRKGIATGILSNTSHSHWTDPRQGVVQRVHHPHASYLLGVMKPHPAVYRAFEKATGFAPSDLLFFDDLSANVKAAHAAGWRAELIDPAADPAHQMWKHLAHHGFGLSN